MTVPFSPAQKYRILVTFDAQIIVDGSLVPVSRYAYGTGNDALRFRKLRRELNCAVKCACGCDTWAPLSEIDFDHVLEHVSGGLTAISNGAPLRRSPCHAKKTAASAATTGWVRRVKRKLSVTITRDDSTSKESRTRKWSWPTRSLTDPKWKKCFGGRVERRAS